jgi:hypothetical protein
MANKAVCVSSPDGAGWLARIFFGEDHPRRAEMIWF